MSPEKVGAGTILEFFGMREPSLIKPVPLALHEGNSPKIAAARYIASGQTGVTIRASHGSNLGKATDS